MLMIIDNIEFDFSAGIRANPSLKTNRKLNMAITYVVNSGLDSFMDPPPKWYYIKVWTTLARKLVVAVDLGWCDIEDMDKVE